MSICECALNIRAIKPFGQGLCLRRCQYQTHTWAVCSSNWCFSSRRSWTCCCSDGGPDWLENFTHRRRNREVYVSGNRRRVLRVVSVFAVSAPAAAWRRPSPDACGGHGVHASCHRSHSLSVWVARRVQSSAVWTLHWRYWENKREHQTSAASVTNTHWWWEK